MEFLDRIEVFDGNDWKKAYYFFTWNGYVWANQHLSTFSPYDPLTIYPYEKWRKPLPDLKTDDPVEVYSEGQGWLKRHFHSFSENGACVLVYPAGYTSWTNSEISPPAGYKEWRLPENE